MDTVTFTRADTVALFVSFFLMAYGTLTLIAMFTSPAVAMAFVIGFSVGVLTLHAAWPFVSRVKFARW